MAYLPILDILRAYFDIEEGDQEYIIKKKLEEKILQLDERLKSALPPFQELLSLKVEDEKYPQLQTQQKKVRTFEAIRDLLVLESENEPLILAVEDLHWIDKTSEEFLNYLIDWLANTRILLILLYRPEYVHQWGSKSYYSKIGVDQLSTKKSLELVQVILEGGEVVQELRDLVLGRAGGNPLFVEELTCNLLENGFIQRKDYQYVLTKQPSEIQVPDTIQGIIAARIDRVEDDLKQIMLVASVIGREFAFRILQTITGMREELKSHLLNLQGLEFISEKRLFPELEYIFKHALTQEVAYNSLLHKRRREIHERIGEAIETLYPERLEEYYELLAYHYGRSPDKSKTLEYLILANQKASELNAVEEAMVYFDKAMKLLDTLPDTEENQLTRISLLLKQWPIILLLMRFGEWYTFLTRYEDVAIRLGNQGLLGAYYGGVGHCEWAFGRYEEAIQTLTKAAELCEAAGDAEYVGYVYWILEWSHLMRGNYRQVLTLKQLIHRMIEEQFNLRLYVWTSCAAVWANSHLGRWEEALEEGHEALRVAEEYSDHSLMSILEWLIAMACTLKGEFVRATEYGESSLQKAPTPADKTWAQHHLAWTWCRAGHAKRGVEILAQLNETYRAVGFMIGVLSSGLHLSEGYQLLGNYDRATEVLEELLEIADRCGARYYLASAHRLLGEIALKTNGTQAARHFEKSIELLREIKAENDLALSYAGYGRFHKQQGDIAQARECLTKALEIFERLGTLIEPDKVRKELAELSGD
jgi:predicted ATPase